MDRIIENSNKIAGMEIIHEAYFDVIINNTAKQGSVRGIKTAILNNIRNHNPPFFNWLQNEKDSALYYDKSPKPKFVAKRRKMTRNHYDFIAALKMPGDDLEKRVVYAMSSVSNELNMSQPINTAISDKKLQLAVMAHGFGGVKFVEPLLAVIDRSTGNKYVVYEHVEGKPLRLNYGNADDIVREIRQHLREGGIDAHDLTAQQLIFNDRGKELYLLDTEAYLKSSPTEYPETP